MNKKALFLASLLLLAGCGGLPELKKRTFTIELGQDVYANPALYIKDESYNTENLTVTALTAGIGKKDNRFISKGYEYLLVGEYDFALESGSSSESFKIKVKDTQAPTVTAETPEISAYLGENIDWNKYYPATDISGVSYDAPSDTTATEGEHNITLRIYDRFGNSVNKSVKVTVSA